MDKKQHKSGAVKEYGNMGSRIFNGGIQNLKKPSYLYLSSQNINTESCNENIGPQKWGVHNGNFCLICIVQKLYILAGVQLISHFRKRIRTNIRINTRSSHNANSLSAIFN